MSATGGVVFHISVIRGKSLPMKMDNPRAFTASGYQRQGANLEKRISLALLALVAIILVGQVLLRDALPVDETRVLDVAWEMRLSGNLFELTQNFAPYAHKPPLLYWLINLVWLVTGPSALAARLVGPALALVMLALSARLARRFWPGDPDIGFSAMAVLAGFTLFILYAGTTMFDALLGIAVLAGVMAIWRIGQGETGRGPYLALGLALGGGILAKGPVVFIHLLPLLCTMSLWAPSRPSFGGLLRGLGLALAVAAGLVGLWLVPALAMMESATRFELLWSQSANRVAGSLGHGRPIWFLAALLPVLLFPWGWSWRLWRAVPRIALTEAAGRFCAIWALSGLVLFSVIGGKQIHYLLPELPAVALLAARAMQGALRRLRGGSLAFLLPAGLGLAAAVFGLGLFPATGALADLSPAWPVLLFAMACLGLAAVAWRLPLFPGHLTLGLGLALALHGLAGMTGLVPAHSAETVAARLVGHAEQGIAVVGMPYQAEFNFAARLTSPVDAPSLAQLSSWMAAHPGGIVAAPVGTPGMPGAPDSVVRYRGGDLGFWPAL